MIEATGGDVVKVDDGRKEEGSAWGSAQASEPWRQVCGEGNSDQGGIFFLFLIIIESQHGHPFKPPHTVLRLR